MGDRIAVRCLVLLCALHASPLPACGLTVNGDGNGLDVADDELTLYEAEGIAYGTPGALSCLTQSELDQISGEIVAPNPLCGTLEPRFNLVGGCGLNSADQIGFADTVGTIALSNVRIVNSDSIDGRKPNGSRVTLQGQGIPSPQVIEARGDPLSQLAPVVSIRNLVVTGGVGIGIQASELAGVLDITGVEVYGNGGNGIQLGTPPASVFPSCAGIVALGGTGPGEENYIHSNGGWGIAIYDDCDSSIISDVRLRNNFVGLSDALGISDAGNALGGVLAFFARGVWIGGSAVNERNYIGWNDGPGVEVTDGLTNSGTRVQGNWIGLARDLPTAPRPNAIGVRIVGGNDVSIGGATPAEGNVISGNLLQGVVTEPAGATSGVLIQNNVIGLDPARTLALGNGQDGVALRGSFGASVLDNVISGNGGNGVQIEGGGNTRVETNVVGLRGSANSTNDNTAAGNGQAGIWVNGSPGAAIGAGNRVAANAGTGVRISGENADGTQLRGNVIGLSNGNDPRPNGGGGLFVDNGPDNTLIGGSSAADRNTISGNAFDGLRITGPAVNGVVIRGNYIGLSPQGLGDAGNARDGVRIETGVSSAEVVGNQIAGNGLDGVGLLAMDAQAKVQGNVIGLDLGGQVVGNAASGIALGFGTVNALVGDATAPNLVVGNSIGIYVANAGTSGNVISGNTVGGTLAGRGNGLGITVRSGATNNIVSGNTVVGSNGPGIELLGAGTSGNTVRGNFVGVTAAGVAGGNAGGVRVAGGASGNVIGGATAAERNVVGGNALYGLAFTDAGTQSNVAVGNYIGIDPGGLNPRPNPIGVLFDAGAVNNTASTNVISGNSGDGVRIQGNGTNGSRVQANRIGLTPTGSALLPNGGDGIRITANAANSVVGTLPPQANLVRGNLGAGIRVESGSGNDLTYNALQGNGGLGIDLGPNGVTLNDPLDADAGANDLLNSPLLSNVVQNGSMLSLTVAQASALPSASIAVILHAVGACDPSGRGEGDTPLDAVSVNTNASGNASVNAMVPLPGPGLVAAVTGTSFIGTGSTSEFSPCAVPAGFTDAVFANGFEQAPPGAPAPARAAGADALAAPLRVERVDAARVRAIVQVDAGASGATAARSLSLGSTAAVVVERIDAAGMACELLGAIVCEVPELRPGQSAQATVLLGVARGEAELWLETREASGAYGRVARRIDEPGR